MNTNIIAIPLFVAAMIGAVYLGALQILLGLRQAYVAQTAGQPSLIPTVTINSVALPAATIGLLLVVAAAAMVLNPAKKSTRPQVN